MEERTDHTQRQPDVLSIHAGHKWVTYFPAEKQESILSSLLVLVPTTATY